MNFDFGKLTYRPGPKPAPEPEPVAESPAVERPAAKVAEVAGRVVDVRSEPCDVYIGRPKRGFPTGPWGNPFKIGQDGDRAEVIRKYRDWVTQQPELMSKLPQLKGKTLGCWCAPDACHGDILLELANNQLPPETVLALWSEKTAVTATDNTDLVQWHESIGSPPEELRRASELNAAAVLSLTLGQYVEEIIRPHLTKRRLTEDERAANILRLQHEFDQRVKGERLRPCKACGGYGKLDRKHVCAECSDDTDKPTTPALLQCY